MRAVKSAAPPGGTAMMSRIGRPGYVCAMANCENTALNAAAATAVHALMILPSRSIPIAVRVQLKRVHPVQSNHRPSRGSALNFQVMDGKQALGVRPPFDRIKAGAAGQRLEAGHRILVGIFGVDGLAGAEADGATADPHPLPPETQQVHLDAAGRLVVERLVAERGEIEIGTELAVDARKQVEIEFGRDALPVVVRGV